MGRGRLDVVELGDTVIGRIAYRPGWRWSQDVRPIVGTERCEVHHLGVVLSGRLYVEMLDGSGMELGPDDVFELPPGHDAWVLGDEPWVSIDSVGRRHFGKPSDAPSDRVLLTILFTDLVASTELVTRIGDAAWRDRIADYNQRVGADVERFRGRTIAATGDGLLAVFDSPTSAVRAALAMDRTATELDLTQRAGLHPVRLSAPDPRSEALPSSRSARSRPGRAHQVLVSAAAGSFLAGRASHSSTEGHSS